MEPRRGLLGQAQSPDDIGRSEAIKEIAAALQKLGVRGDTSLVHVNPQELAALEAQTPGGLKQNPITGLPAAWPGAGGVGSAGRGASGGPAGNNGGGAGGRGMSGVGSENAAHGTASSTSAGRDRSYGGSWGGGSGVSGGDGDAPDYSTDYPSDDVIGGLISSIDRDPRTGANPEMGGSPDRDYGQATVDALGWSSLGGRAWSPGNVNAASAVSRGLSPSFSDDISDTFGVGTPRGFIGSDFASGAVSALASAIPGIGQIVGPVVGAAWDIGVRDKPIAEVALSALDPTPMGLLSRAVRASQATEDMSDVISRRASLNSYSPDATETASRPAAATAMAARSQPEPSVSEMSRGSGLLRRRMA